MLLSSKSQRCFGLSHQIPRCTFQRDKVTFSRLSHSLCQVFRCFGRIQPVFGITESSLCVLQSPSWCTHCLLVLSLSHLDLDCGAMPRCVGFLHTAAFVFRSVALCSTHALVRCTRVSPLFLERCSVDVVVFHSKCQTCWHD